LLVPLDAELVADAIERVLGDDALAARLGAAGRELAVVELDPGACSARIDTLYRALVEGRG
jgi:glycosyltransferase involved in cell wall biosynthesis